MLNRRGWNPPEDGPNIWVEAELLNKLANNKNRQSQQDQNYLSLLVAERCENNRSAPLDDGGERRKQQIVGGEGGVSSCPCEFLEVY